MAKKKKDEELPDKDVSEEQKDEEDSSPQKKEEIVKIAMLAGVIVFMVVASYFLQRIFIYNAPTTAESHTQSKEKSDHDPADVPEEPGEIVLLDEIIVNPAGTGGRRFLAATIGFEITMAGKDEKKDSDGGHGGEGSWIDSRKPLVRDALIDLLSAKSIVQLADITYRDTLRKEIHHRIASELRPHKVARVFFTGYVLQ